MELKDTIEDMISDDFERRYRAEHRQLCIRINRLVNYIKHYKADINSLELAMKEQQLAAMVKYKNILELRASIEKINL